MKKTYVKLLLGVVLLGGLVFFWLSYKRTSKIVLKVETKKIIKSDLQAKVLASGTLSALVTVQVGSQVSGRLQEIMVDYNTPVKKGQVIARLDSKLFASAVQQAEANYRVATARLTSARFTAQEAEKQFKRTQTLAKTELVAKADLDTASAKADTTRAAIAEAEGNVALAAAALAQARVNLAYTTITSPIDGLVIARNVDVGQTVAASLQAPVLFLIAEDLRKMQIDTAVAEADIGKLTAEMPVTFTVDAYPGEKFKGKVRQIRNSAQTVQNVVTYDAVIDVANEDLRLKPGMSANVTFVYASREQVLCIPNAALRFKPSTEFLALYAQALPSSLKNAESSAKHLVWSLGISTPGKAVLKAPELELVTPIELKTGLSDGVLTEIVDGALSAGNEVLIDVTVLGEAAKNGKSTPMRGMGPGLKL